jgi:hypothetical protein
MEKLADFDFAALEFDGDGTHTNGALAGLLAHVAAHQTTDVILIAHGFRNDEGEARSLYENFLKNFRAHMTRPELAAAIGQRSYAVGGIFWPSKQFSEGAKKKGKDEGSVQGLDDERDPAQELRENRAQLERLRDEDVRADQRATVDQALALLDQLEGNPDVQDEFVALLLSLVDEADPDPNEGLAELKAKPGSELIDRLGAPIILPTRQDDGDGGVLSVGDVGGGDGDGRPLFIGGLFKSVAGRVGQVLNMTTWYMMKNRSGTVGAVGVAPVVRALKGMANAPRVHLVGHSLGGRCMTACAKALCAAPMVRPDSLTLLEAAFSHYGLSANNGKGTPGFFRDVIERQVVRGPFVSTFSYQDTVVGIAYAMSSRLSGDNVKAIGDKDDQFGGIGRNGTQRTVESTSMPLAQVGAPYAYTAAVVNNIDGSGGGIKDHSDVTNPRVTYAFAWAVAGT